MSDRGAPTQVLVVASTRDARAVAARLRRTLGWVCRSAASADRARELIAERDVELALVADDRGGAMELVGELVGRGTGVVMLTHCPDLESAVGAMRAGALDQVELPLVPDDLSRLGDALARTARARGGERYRRATETLLESQESMSAQVGSMCDQLADAYQYLTEEMSQMRTLCEFEALIRQELELEPLLRTVLEYLLAKLGSTNAAIFLPASQGSYSLGAYVNYDCPRDEVEARLDAMATTVGMRFESRPGVTAMPHARALGEHLGAHAADLEGYGAVCVPSVEEDGECLAVTFLFRDERTPFGAECEQTLAMLAPVFAAQLARVIRVHHRHVASDPWGLAGDADDDLDLAA